MRPLLSIKTLFRSPFKTLLTFLLLASVTFALFSSVSEYSITNREIKNAAKEYRAVCSAETAPALESHSEGPSYIETDPRRLQYSSEKIQEYYRTMRYQPLSQEQISYILGISYVTSSDTRYMIAGVSDKYQRLDDGEDYYNYNARFIIEGTLSEANYNDFGTEYNKLTLNDCNLLAGDPSCLPMNKKITIDAYSDKINQGVVDFGGQRTEILYDNSYIYDTEYVKNLTIGNRYVIVGRFDSLGDPIRYFLSDHLTNPWCEAVQTIEGQPRNYIETEQFAPLRELIELTDSDLHTFDVVCTEDMSAIMRFAEGNMAVTSGRGLTKEDSISKSSVCVVSNGFASDNNLNVGDKITLKLGTELFEQYKGLGAVAAVRERYSSPDKMVELEIVGIYMDADVKVNQSQKPHWSYSINTVFVPKSLLPMDESKLDNHMFSPSEFSFMVDDALNIPSFIEKAVPIFEEMGLKLIVYDDGWLDIVDEFETSRKLSIITVLALSGAMIAATGFIVFLFIGRKKKEYAIMRALGTTGKESAKALTLPLMGVTVFAVFVGSCAAWIYAVNTVEKNNILSKIEGYAVNSSMPVIAAIGCIVSEVLLVLLFALFGLRRIGAIPPLVLLQDNQNKKASSNMETQGNRKPTYIETKTDAESSVLNATIFSDPYTVRKVNTKRPWKQVLRYISKHIRRSAKKTMLSILLSSLLFGAVGQFAAMRRSYVELCDSTVIKAKFINGLSLKSVMQILATGYVSDPYYEYKNSVEFDYMKTDLVITNDIARYTGEDVEITYAEGYDASCMKETGRVCIVGSRLLEENGLKPGDKVLVAITDAFKNIQSSYINRYRIGHSREAISDEEILELCNDQIMKEYIKKSLYYTIAGYVTTPSVKYDRIVFTPGTFKTTPIFGFEVPLDMVEFTLAENLYADEFRSYAGMVTGGSSGEYSSNSIAFIMDTSKIENLLNTLNFLNKLFPLVVAAAVLIGGLLCGLIIIQTTKEAAIMRVLGMPRRRTIAVLSFEQIFLCLTGMILGAVGLLLYNGEYLKEIAIEMYLFAALYFVGCLAGTFICSVMATRRKLLELLQTKE